jgi:twitching motility protein PilT
MEKEPDPAGVDRARVEKILRVAFRNGASDVHFKAGERVLLRIKGKLQAVDVPPLRPHDTEAVLRALRPEHVPESALEGLEELDFSYSVSGVGRFRVNAFRQRGSVALVVRVIPLEVPTLKDLNLPQAVESLAKKLRGLVLVTGATGSGKSTTLAALIDQINATRTSHVITIEDPIEFFFRNQRCSIVQREIGSDTSSFSGALRAALRQDPDVIMIGEMRDTETIDIALKAAETGHLVLSSVHTTDAVKTVHRLISVFPTSEQAMVRIRVAEALQGVVSQRLLPRLDQKGLVLAAEVMVSTRAIQECIREGEWSHQLPELIARGSHYGMQTLDQALLELLREQRIGREVALSAATSPGELDLQIRMGGSDDDMQLDHHIYDEQAEKTLPTIPEPDVPEPDVPEQDALEADVQS